MIEVNVYKPIGKEDVFYSLFGMEDPFAFSADTIQKLISDNPNETEIKFNINCDGGSVSEGLRIYDILRTSGKTIYCNIENSCHSMAIVLLLAAPTENRTANRNSRALIHQVYGGMCGYANADDLRAMADEIEREQNAILDIYEERTTADRPTLENLMKEEKQRTVQELIDYGFISKINPYTTNSKQMNPNNKKDKKGLINLADNFLKGLKNFLGETVNYDFTDADGNVLFSTEKEDDSLAVGDVVTIPDGSTDGTFTLQDGSTVVIAGGKVESITEPSSNSEDVEALQAENTTLQAENTALTEKVNKLTAKLNEASGLITDLKNQVGSSYNAAGRQTVTGKPRAAGASTNLKDEVREKRNLANGGSK